MMKVIKWEIDSDFNGNTQELLENGWEPFATKGSFTMFRRPVGYIEVEEKVIEQQPKPVVTKELKYDLDHIEKYENPVGEAEIQHGCHNDDSGIEY